MKYLIWLTCNTSFSPAIKRFLDIYTPKELYSFQKEEYIKLGFSDAQISRLMDKSLDGAEKILNICRLKGIKPIPYNSPEYPERLLKARDFPLVLYVRGNISVLKNRLCVGIVGTRSSTPRGESFTEKLAVELIEKGALIISGGASGIDTVGLWKSLERKAECVAVLGCDIDRYYPSNNYALFEQVATSGLVISEYPPCTNARYFPMRNRIIAALSERLVVTEAPEKSGALITAEYAVGYSVPVFATNFDGESFSGCRGLVSRGAREITTADDVINFSEPTPIKKEKKERRQNKIEKIEPPKTVKNYKDERYLHIIKCINEGRDTPEQMKCREYGITDILCILTELEIMGDIKELPGNKFKLN